MLNTFELLTILSIVSALFVFIFTVAIDRLQIQRRLFLISLLWLIIFWCSYELTQSLGLLKINIILLPLYHASFFLTYPLLYIYILRLTVTPEKIKLQKVAPHFLIAALIFVFILSIYSPLNYNEKVKFVNCHLSSSSEPSSPFGLFQIVIVPLYYLQFIVYVFLNTMLMIKIKKTAPEQKIFLSQFILLMTLGMVLYEVVVACGTILRIFDAYDIRIFEQLVGLLFILLIGYLIMKQSLITIQYKLLNSVSDISNNQVKAKSSNNLSEETKLEIMDAMEKYVFLHQLYRDPNLKLEQLSKKIHIPVKKLSFVINNVYGCNFSTFINKYRILEAKRLISQIKESGSLEEIYLKIGFNSKSTFYRVFKEITGLPPVEYLNKTQSSTDQLVEIIPIPDSQIPF